MRNQTIQTAAGLAYARQVLSGDLKTTNGDLDFLTVAIIEIRGGRPLRQDQEDRADRLMARAVSLVNQSISSRRGRA